MEPPFLRRVGLVEDRIDRAAFPFDRLPFLARADFALELDAWMTVIAGENGAGKSTFLEAVAAAAGFDAAGGSRDHRIAGPAATDAGALARALRLSWLPKVTDGFFFRAETFASVASYIDAVGNPGRYGAGAFGRDASGGGRIAAQSHGESFLALFESRFGRRGRTFYILDEPEAALSPARQVELLRVFAAWRKSGAVQALVATHSPILMKAPGARLLWLDRAGGFSPIAAEETTHWRLLASFLADPAAFTEE